MKLILEGREDRIKTLEKLNALFCKRNDVKLTIVDELKEEEVKAEVEEQITSPESKAEENKPRKRRTKAEIEADKQNKK